MRAIDSRVAAAAGMGTPCALAAPSPKSMSFSSSFGVKVTCSNVRLHSTGVL